MIGYIITGICCFAIGSIAGVICVSFCCAGAPYDDTEQTVDYYHGCSDDCKRRHNNEESGGVSE